MGLQWLAKDDPLKLNPKSNITSIKDVSIIQRYAISCLYFATNGQSWINSYNFLSGSSECEWNIISNNGTISGVGGCDPDGTIKVISLYNNNLQGHIPREIELLKNLRVLSLYDNKLKGIVTTHIKNLKGLKTLYLHGNNILGSIDFLCINNIPNLRSDCHGPKAEITCNCCQVCCNPEGDCFQDGN